MEGAFGNEGALRFACCCAIDADKIRFALMVFWFVKFADEKTQADEN
jgi:hypothetical protein